MKNGVKPALLAIRNFSSSNAIVLVLASLVLIIGAVRPSFLHPENLLNILRYASSSRSGAEESCSRGERTSPPGVPWVSRPS
jgi:hypothetical protein